MSDENEKKGKVYCKKCGKKVPRHNFHISTTTGSPKIYCSQKCRDNAEIIEERALVEDACRETGIEDEYYVDKMLDGDD